MSIFIGIFIPVKKQHMALGRPVNKGTQYKVIVHTLGKHRYAATKVFTVGENGKKQYTYKHWGTLEDGNRFHPGTNYFYASVAGFTACKEYYEQKDEPIAYFTVNPNLDSNQEIKISPYLEFIIDSYFSLCDEEKELVRQCIGLLYEGIELFNTNRSVSLLSIVSSIEGMANLDLKIYGNGERLGPTDRFLRYLKTYVAGRSEQKFRGFYKRRCDIAHEGRLFLSDLDLYGDIQKQDEDWRLRLEILQAARLAMYNWMRRRQQDG